MNILAPVMLVSSIVFNDGVSQLSAPFQDMGSCMKAARAMVLKDAKVEVDGNTIRAVSSSVAGTRTVIQTITCNPTGQ